jgi:hypothetical protein
MSLPDRLDRLVALHQAGHLSDEEFEQAKAVALSAESAAPGLAQTATPESDPGRRRYRRAALVAVGAGVIGAVVVGAMAVISQQADDAAAVGGGRQGERLWFELHYAGWPCEGLEGSSPRVEVSDETGTVIGSSSSLDCANSSYDGRATYSGSVTVPLTDQYGVVAYNPYDGGAEDLGYQSREDLESNSWTW